MARVSQIGQSGRDPVNDSQVRVSILLEMPFPPRSTVRDRTLKCLWVDLDVKRLILQYVRRHIDLLMWHSVCVLLECHLWQQAIKGFYKARDICASVVSLDRETYKVLSIPADSRDLDRKLVQQPAPK
jgi:hypothetical protein